MALCRSFKLIMARETEVSVVGVYLLACSIVRGRMKGADSAIYSIMHCRTVQYIYNIAL